MQIELLRGAEADLLENYVRFEELNEGLGERFYRTIDYVLERIRQFPEIAPGLSRPISPACGAPVWLWHFLFHRRRTRDDRRNSRLTPGSTFHSASLVGLITSAARGRFGCAAKSFDWTSRSASRTLQAPGDCRCLRQPSAMLAERWERIAGNLCDL